MLCAGALRAACARVTAARGACWQRAKVTAAARSGGGVPQMQDVVDLTSPPARPRRRRRTADIIDLTGATPDAMAAPVPAPVETLVVSDLDDDMLAVPLAERLGLRGAAGGAAAASPRRRSRSRSPEPPAAAAAGAAAALNAPPLPPRRLAQAGFTKDLRKRGLLPVAPSGRLLCRWCQREVPPPKARLLRGPCSLRSASRPERLAQISFCSPACLHEHQLRSDPGYARKARAAALGCALGGETLPGCTELRGALTRRPGSQVTFDRDAGQCSACGLHAHLLYLGAAAAPPGCGVPAARRRGMHRWASNATLKAALKAHAATQGTHASRAVRGVARFGR